MKKVIKKIYSNLFLRNVLIVFFSLFFVELFVRLLLFEPFFDWAMFRIFISIVIFSLLFNFISLIFSTVGRKIFLFFIIFIFSIYSWFQFCLYNYLDFFMSITNIGQGMKATEFLSELFASVTADIYLILFPFILVLFYYLIFEKSINVRFFKNDYKKKLGKKSFFNNSVVISIVIFVISIFVYIGTLNFKFMQDDLQVVPNKFLIVAPTNSNLVVRQFGTCVYLVVDITSSIFNLKGDMYSFNKNDYVDKEVDSKKYNVAINNDDWLKIMDEDYISEINNINEFLFTRNISEKNEMTGVFKDKNLIIVLLESVNMMAINEEKFPTLYKLYNEGISFTNNYSPKSFCTTATNEMITMTGVLPSNNFCLVSHGDTKNNTYFQSVFNVFRSNDYVTSSYHGYPDFYYPRSEYHYLVGSEKYYGPDKLKVEYKTDSRNWSSDIELVEKALPKFIDNDKFLAYLVTVTPHLSYRNKTVYDNYMKLWNDTNYTDKTKRYLAKLKVTDLALEKLLNELEENGKLDDTVIALFGDHYPVGLREDEIRDVLGEDMRSDINDFDKTPMMIYNSEMEPKKIEKYTSITDLLPTLLNLFGVKHDSRLYMGNDVFSEYDDCALFADGSWRNEYGFYSATTSDFIVLSDAKKYSNLKLSKINQYNMDRLMVNELILQNNYFEYLEEKLKKYSK